MMIKPRCQKILGHCPFGNEWKKIHIHKANNISTSYLMLGWDHLIHDFSAIFCLKFHVSNYQYTFVEIDKILDGVLRANEAIDSRIESSSMV